MRTVGYALVAGCFMACGGSDSSERTNLVQLPIRYAAVGGGIDCDNNPLFSSPSPDDGHSVVRLHGETLLLSDLSGGVPVGTYLTGIVCSPGGRLLANSSCSTNGCTQTGMYEKADDASSWQAIGLPDGTNGIYGGWAGVDGTALLLVNIPTIQGGDFTFFSKPAAGPWQKVISNGTYNAEYPLVSKAHDIIFGSRSDNKIHGKRHNQAEAVSPLFRCPTDHIDQDCDSLTINTIVTDAIVTSPYSDEIYVVLRSPTKVSKLLRLPADVPFPIDYGSLTQIEVPALGRWDRLQFDRDGRVYVHFATDVVLTYPPYEAVEAVIAHLEPGGTEWHIDGRVFENGNVFSVSPKRIYSAGYQIISGGLFFPDPIYVGDF
jgi:hypothetical protein